MKYTTVHDLRDILSIYRDCKDWRMKFWNFTDQNHLVLRFQKLESGSEPTVVFEASTDSMPSNTVYEFESMLEYIDRQVDPVRMDPLSVENLRIKVINRENGQPMHINFVGSSKPDRTVNWCIDYDNSKFHRFRRWFYWKKLYLTCRFDNIIKRWKK